MKTILDEILDDVAAALASARAARPPSEIRRRIADAPPPQSLERVLVGGFRLVAEIKRRSPSVGPMREQSVQEAPALYRDTPLVAAVSVLTNSTYFGMDIFELPKARAIVGKPVLRKDFLIEEYMVREARAFGADAVLLMAGVLDAARLKGFHDLARELGMQALFEIHEEREIEVLPPNARIVGINSRKFKSRDGFVAAGGSSDQDFSLDRQAFALAARLPAGTIKVAESGLSPGSIGGLRADFDAALVGTAILRDSRGPAACLQDFGTVL